MIGYLFRLRAKPSEVLGWRYLSRLGLLVVCFPMLSCSEASFTLASESRLPKWFTIPADQKRAGLNVTLDYYSGRRASVNLQDANGRNISTVTATVRDQEPQSLKGRTADGLLEYPVFEVLTANNITEVIEHRSRGPVFSVSDDLAVRKALGVP
jgi:hypothetical protein